MEIRDKIAALSLWRPCLDPGLNARTHEHQGGWERNVDWIKKITSV
jgi:hypothetical protein